MNRVCGINSLSALSVIVFLNLSVVQADTLDVFFSCEDTIYIIEYTFSTTCGESLLLDICYDFGHLLNFANQKHTTITKMNAYDGCYTVIYEFSQFFYQSRSTYVKRLLPNLKRVYFEMIDFSQNIDIFPNVLKSYGYYEVGCNDLERKVIYYQKTILDKKPTGSYVAYTAKATEDFLKSFESYVRKHEKRGNTKFP